MAHVFGNDKNFTGEIEYVAVIGSMDRDAVAKNNARWIPAAEKRRGDFQCVSVSRTVHPQITESMDAFANGKNGPFVHNGCLPYDFDRRLDDSLNFRVLERRIDRQAQAMRPCRFRHREVLAWFSGIPVDRPKYRTSHRYAAALELLEKLSHVSLAANDIAPKDTPRERNRPMDGQLSKSLIVGIGDLSAPLIECLKAA